MTTPLEAGAKAVGDLDWSDTRYPPDYDEITRAVFGSIDREGLADLLVAHSRASSEKCLCGWGELGRSHAKHTADAILAWLRSKG